ncbi:MAG: VCBS domain-containing protein, partial [Pseudomonadota bacterium]
VNDIPEPRNDVATTDQDTSVLISVVANDVDPVEGDDLTSVGAINGVPVVPGDVVTLASGATVTVNANGTVSYDPNGQFDNLPAGGSATDTFTYVAVDDGTTAGQPDPQGSDSAVVQVTITGTADGITTTDNVNAVGEDDTAGVSGNVITDDDGNGVDAVADDLPRSKLDFGAAGPFADEASVLGTHAIDGVNVTISNGGDSIGVGQNGTAEHNGQGGENGFMVVQQNAANQTQALDTIFAFDQAVENVSFNVLDLDLATNGNVQDTVEVLYRETAGGPLLAATVSANTAFTDPVGGGFSGEQSVNANNTNGNLFVAIDGPVAEIVVRTSSGPDGNANPAGQVIGIGDICWDHVGTSDLTVQSIDGESDPSDDVAGTYGTLDWNDDGSYTYTLDVANAAVQALDDGEVLTDVFNYTAVDENGQTSQSSLTITINGTNDAPKVQDPNNPNVEDPNFALPDLANSDSDEITTGAPVDLSQYFFDVEPGDEPNFVFDVTGLPTGLSVDPATGEVTGTIDSSASQGGPNSDGIWPVSVTVYDGPIGAPGTASTVVAFDWTVTNPPPVAEDDALTGDEDTVVTADLFADNDGDTVA